MWDLGSGEWDKWPGPSPSPISARDRLISDKIIVVTWLSLTLLPERILLSATHHLPSSPHSTAAQTQIVPGMRVKVTTSAGIKSFLFEYFLEWFRIQHILLGTAQSFHFILPIIRMWKSALDFYHHSW